MYYIYILTINLDNFNVRKTSSAISAINLRIDELLNINKEIQNKDLIFEEYSKKIELKKEELEKRKEDIHLKDRQYILKYQVNIFCKI